MAVSALSPFEKTFPDPSIQWYAIFNVREPLETRKDLKGRASVELKSVCDRMSAGMSEAVN